jgi:hypothetical protein
MCRQAAVSYTYKKAGIKLAGTSSAAPSELCCCTSVPGTHGTPVDSTVVCDCTREHRLSAWQLQCRRLCLRCWPQRWSLLTCQSAWACRPLPAVHHDT